MTLNKIPDEMNMKWHDISSIFFYEINMKLYDSLLNS